MQARNGRGAYLDKLLDEVLNPPQQLVEDIRLHMPSAAAASGKRLPASGTFFHFIPSYLNPAGLAFQPAA